MRAMFRLHPAARAAGFTYIGLLILIGILGTTTAATMQVGSLLQRRAAEQDLLAIGLEYRQALITYADATPVGQNPLPATLDDLLRDPRYPGIRRHLRRKYVDPITRSREWGLVLSPSGQGIVGIHSLSTAQPIKVGRFAPPFDTFDNKSRYSDWVFARLEPTVGQAALPVTPTRP